MPIQHGIRIGSFFGFRGFASRRCSTGICTEGQGTVAIKSVAHKLARASYHVMRNHVAFDVSKAFAR